MISCIWLLLPQWRSFPSRDRGVPTAFIHQSYFWAPCIPGTRLGSGNTGGKETDERPVVMELTCQWQLGILTPINRTPAPLPFLFLILFQVFLESVASTARVYMKTLSLPPAWLCPQRYKCRFLYLSPECRGHVPGISAYRFETHFLDRNIRK